MGDSLASGGANTESLGASMAALSKRTDDAKIAQKAFTQARGDADVGVAAVTALYKGRKEELEKTTEAYNALKNAELAVRLVEKEFSTERDAFQNAFVKGFIDANGRLAKSDKEVTKNRLANLQRIVDKGKVATESLKAAQPGNLMISAYKKDEEAGRKATEAAIGAAFKLRQEIEKINVELDKRIKKLNEELLILQKQNELAAYRRKTAEIQATAQRTATMDQAIINNIYEVELRQLQDQIASSQALLQIGKNRIDGETAIAEAMEKQAKAASDLKIAQVERANQAAMAPLRRQEAVQRDLPNLSSDQQKNNLQKAIAIQEFNNGMRLIAERKTEVEREAAAQKAAIDRRERLLNLELSTKQAEMKTQEDIVKKQKDIADLNNKIELDKAKLNLELANRRKGELELEQGLTNQRIESQKNNRLAELDIVKKRLELIKTEADVFEEIVAGNTKWVNKFIEGVNALGNNVQKLKVEDVTATFKTIKDETDRAQKSLEGAELLINQIAKKQQDNAKAEFDAKTKQARADATQAQMLIDQIKERQRIDSELKAAQAARIEAASKSEIDLLNDKITALGIERSAVDTNLAATKTKLQTEAEGLRNNLQLRLEALQRERDAIAQLLNTIAGIINDRLNKGVDDLFEALKNGTLTMNNFKQGVMQLFKDILFDIGKEIFKKSVLEPIQNSIKSALGGLLGGLTGGVNKQISTIQGMITTGQSVIKDDIAGAVTNLKEIGIQSVYVTNVAEFCACSARLPGDAAIPGGDLIDMFKGGQGALDSLRETNDTIASFEDDFANDYFKVSDATSTVTGSLGDFTSKLSEGTSGLGGFVSQLFSLVGLGGGAGGGGGGGGLLGSIVSGIGGLFGGGAAAAGTFGGGFDLVYPYAAGGLVSDYGAIKRFAGGGNVMYQDRVPALLEPGEFVMKKSAVDSIGKSSMERMNASGKAPPVKVQIENSGSEKEAEQGDTQFDGEAMIVKLILKDLKSNGPIRKSMRANL